MSRQMRHIGTCEGSGIFTNRETNEDYAVDYQLEEQEAFIPYPDGREASLRRDFEGTISPVPDGTQIFGKPNTLKLVDGRVVECWIQNRRGDVKCQISGALTR